VIRLAICNGNLQTIVLPVVYRLPAEMAYTAIRYGSCMQLTKISTWFGTGGKALKQFNMKQLLSVIKVMFGDHWKVDEDCVTVCILYNNADLDFQNLANETAEHICLQQPHCHSAPPLCGTFTFSSLIACIYLHSFFVASSVNTWILKQTVQGHPRILILVWIVCEFRFVSHSNLGPILNYFRDIAAFLLITPPLFYINFGVFPLDQIADVGVSPSQKLKLISHKIIFEVFQPTWKNTPKHHRRTNRQTDCLLWHNCTLHSIAR